MQSDYIELFSSNTDASHSIRGIYYQFLVTLEKWLLSYVNNDNMVIEIEVDDDIKEISNEIILTQVKSYTRSFSFNSIEVKKSLLNFYFSFLKYSSKTPMKFCFYTNTTVSKSEKLLIRWINEGIKEDNLKILIRKKVIRILKESMKKKKNKLLNKAKGKEIKSNIKRAEQNFLNDLTFDKIDHFISCINWVFHSKNPGPEIIRIEKSIEELLKKDQFNQTNSFILKRVLLSEIFKLSKSSQEERKLTKSLLAQLLRKSEEELFSHLNLNFLHEINNKYDELESKVNEIQKDQIHIQREINKKQLPIKSIEQFRKEMTLLPIESHLPIFGREEEMKDFMVLLSKESKINIHGFHGIGKTFFVKKIIETFYNEFDHIVWLDCFSPIENVILSNSILLENLGLPINQFGAKEYIKQICYKLNNIEGNNILILDNYESRDLILSTFLSLRGWKVIVISKEKTPDIKNYTLNKIEFIALKSYFLQQLDIKEFEDNIILLKLFEKVDNNPLILKICAKTINNSLDLDIETLLKRIESQELDNEELEIEIVANNEKSKSIISFFFNKFKLDQLSDSNSSALSFFSILPSDNLRIEDLAMLGGKDHFEVNKKHYLNIINELDRTGWIERKDDIIKMSKFLQSIIRYQEQQSISPFVANGIYISWLCHRIKEFLESEPDQVLRFLKLGESILEAIPHKHRQGIYQPLILLENEILYSYGILFNFSDYENRWNSLLKNAKQNLSSDDPNLGVIYNNLALSNHESDNPEEVIKYLNHAISIYRKNISNPKFETLNLLIMSSINIAHFLLYQKKYAKAKDKLNQIFSLYKSFHLKEDYLFVVTLGMNAHYFREIEEIERAIEIYDKAILIYNNLEENNIVFNKAILCSILISLTYCKLLIGENVAAPLKRIENCIDDMRMIEFGFGLKLLETIVILYEKVGQYDKAVKLNKIIQNRKIILNKK